jgi:Alternative complex III, ActD subunit
MSSEIALISTFANDHDCARGITAVHEAHAHDFRAFAPFPSEHMIEAAQEARGHGHSAVRWFVLLGGIAGFLTAVVVQIGTAMEWNLNVGGRPIASIPPYVPIMFELMILFGGVSGVIGFFLLSRLPVFDPEPGYRSRFGADKFGLVVRCEENEAQKFEALLRDAGAEDVQREAA